MGQTDATGSLRLNASVGVLSGVGPARQRQLQRLGIRTIADLLRHFPARYEDHAAEGTIAELSLDNKTVGSVCGTVEAMRWEGGSFGGPRRTKGRLMATLKDA